MGGRLTYRSRPEWVNNVDVKAHPVSGPPFPDAEVVEFVGRAMKRSAAVVHRQMSQGLNSLATVASIAPLVGIFGSLIGIVNSFPGFAGEKHAILWMIFARLSEACVPTALGLLIAVPAVCCYKYLTGRLECIDREMESASIELVNLLTVLPVRLASAVGVSFVTDTPVSRDDFGDELREDRRPWYRSSVVVVGTLIISWCVQIARYFDDGLPLESATRRACVYVVFTFAASWFAAYPVLVKFLHRRSGALAASASLICLGWSVVELFLGEHLW